MMFAIAVTLSVRQHGEYANWEVRRSQVLGEAIRIYDTRGQGELRRYLEDLRDSQRVRAYLFDEQGQELTGHGAPHWAETMYHGGLPPPPRDFWERLTPSPFQRESASAASGHRYTMVVFLVENPFGPHGVPGLGILVGVISSGIVCYLLARYLTRPVTRLRAATQKLAAGDLTARAGAGDSRGRDEIAQLVRDFDAMAGRLETLVNTQSRLLTDISHELRSPLARLKVALALARQRGAPEERSALERIDLEADRLNELITRLLTVARLESSSDTLEKLPIYLKDLITEIARDAEFEAQNRRCRVELDATANCLVTGNSALLRSAIENVVRNAARYTGESTAVQVSLEEGRGAQGPEAVIRVKDAGPGVPDETLDKLFRPFYRIDDSRGRQTGGAGLGLAISERAVRLHGGSITAANTARGGLEVEIRLPLAFADSSNGTSASRATS